MITGIYCILNTKNGKKYVGKAKDIAGRWRSHRCELRKGVHGNGYLQNAWNKYGEEAFRFYVLEEVPKEKLTDAEIEWIAKFDTANTGYNLTLGGEGQFGRYLTEAQKKHLSEINTGDKNPNYGLKRSAETRAKMSNAMKGKKRGTMPEYQRRAISDGNRGKKRPWFNKPVFWIEEGKTFLNLSEAAEKTGFSISGISKVCRGSRKTIYNQHFIFLEVQ